MKRSLDVEDVSLLDTRQKRVMFYTRNVMTMRRVIAIAVVSFLFCYLFVFSKDQKIINQDVLLSSMEHPEDEIVISLTNDSSSRRTLRKHRKKGKITKNWIVVTSVQYPTEDVKRLASYDDWTLVVVADKKSPKNWTLDGVHYLSVEDQKSLGYSVLERLPYKSYTRKNIGYLYAIQQGAEWIYDTDDDNKPFGKGLEQFDYGDEVSGLRFQPPEDGNFTIKERLFNPYSFFGNKDMWPRGFPLEHITNHTNDRRFFRVCQKYKRPAVQQGLVVKDPDVDAIYRLLHALPESGLSVHFDKFAPSVTMAPDTFSPWNSQNTLFHRSAFFTMFLPVSVSFRTTDIWRSFFSQKLLHLIGETVAFVPPNAIQSRNAHSYLKDFGEETDVYTKAGEIIEFLSNWTCPHTDTVDCVRDLSREFTERQFWEKDDDLLVDLWLNDLEAVGYTLPKLAKQIEPYTIKTDGFKVRSTANCHSAYLDLNNDIPVSEDEPALARAEMKIKSFGEIVDWCSYTTQYPEFNQSYTFPSPLSLSLNHHQLPPLKQNLQTVLVLTTKDTWAHSMGILQRLYQPYFGMIIFCGPYDEEKIDRGRGANYLRHTQPFNHIRISADEAENGFQRYYCISKVAQLRLQNVKGYYFISDDMLFNIWQPVDYDKLNMGTEYTNKDMFWAANEGVSQTKNVLNLVNGRYSSDNTTKWVKEEYAKGLAKNNYAERTNRTFKGTNIEDQIGNADGWSHGDFLYVPTDSMLFAQRLLELFYEARLSHEIAVSKLSYVMSTKFHDCRVNNLWSKRREYWMELYREEYIAFTMEDMGLEPGSKSEVCSIVIHSFYRNLFTKHKAGSVVNCAGADYWSLTEINKREELKKGSKEDEAKINEEEEKRRTEDRDEKERMDREAGVTNYKKNE